MRHDPSNTVDQRGSCADARLHLTIIDKSGAQFQGNVFASIRHEASGLTWRTLHWHMPTRSFLFANLPSGHFTYRAWTSAERSVQGHIDLQRGANHHRITLPQSAPRPRLELRVQTRLAAWCSRISLCRFDGEGDSGLREELQPYGASAILYDLRCDDAVAASVIRPINELGISPELWQFLDAYTQPGQGSSVLSARARFVITTLWVALSPRIRPRVAPEASADEIWSALLGVASTLDTPGLDDIFVWAARVHRPNIARFDQFARAWAERFNGLNNLRGHARGRKPIPEMSSLNKPKVPLRPPPLSDRALRSISAPVLADMAHVLHAIVEEP